MLLRNGLLSLIPLSVILLAADGQAWKDKPVTAWNDDDTKQILTDSPWAKTVQPTIERSNDQRQRRGMGRGGGIGIGGIGIGLPGGMGRRGGMGGPGGYPGGGYPGGGYPGATIRAGGIREVLPAGTARVTSSRRSSSFAGRARCRSEKLN